MKHPFVQALIEIGAYDEYFKELEKFRGEKSQAFLRRSYDDLTRGYLQAVSILDRSFIFHTSTKGSLYWYTILDKINVVYYRIKQETI